MIKMTKIPLTLFAAEKFERGRITFKGKQIWSELSIDYLKQELREEIADAYNYISHIELRHRFKSQLIRFFLQIIYKLI